MAISTAYKNFRDGTILIQDGTGTPLDVTVQYENGDFSASGFNEGNYEHNAYLDRGEFAYLRKTNRTFPTLSFTAVATDFSDAIGETLPDIILKQNAFSAAVSTLGANADVYTLDVTFTCEGTDHGDSADHTLALTDCVLSVDFAEGDPNMFTINATCYGTVTWT